MADLSPLEIEALRRVNARSHLDQCKAMLAGDMEHVRAAFWNRLPEKSRMAICAAAGIGKDKGKGALRELSAGERAQVHAQARRVIRDMEIILRCAQGGMTHDHGEMAGHAFDGIANPGAVQ